MATRTSGTASWGLTAAAVLLTSPGGFAPARAQQEPPPPEQVPEHFCGVDLSRAGQMKNVVWNALGLGFNRPGSSVGAFLDGAETRYATGRELLSAAAAHVGITEAGLWAEVEKYKHVNCGI